jgi:hypothetical protein
MDRRIIALASIAAGVAMALLALLADVLGIGDEGFGWRRGALLAVGVVVALAGVALLLRLSHGAAAREAEQRGDVRSSE